MPGEALYWSKRGEVACVAHAPKQGGPRWSRERWLPLQSIQHVEYQCQHCYGGPIRHVARRTSADPRRT